jgi:hypothetical protein
MDDTNAPELTQEELEKLAAEYRAYPNKKGRPPKKYAQQIAAINKQQKRFRIKTTPAGEKKIIVSKPDRIEAFCEEFIKNGGNATQAALVVSKTKNITSAASMGSQYLKQAKILGRIVMEKKGFHYGKMIDVAAEKMAISKSPEWWDRLMKIADYEDFTKGKKDPSQIVNIVGVQKAAAQEFGFEEAEVVDEEE